MPKRQQALVAVSDSDGRNALASTLAVKGLEPLFASTLEEARSILKREPVVVVFCQSQLEDGGFHDMLAGDVRGASKVPVVVCSPSYDHSLYMDAMSRGAFDFVAYPYSQHEIEWILSCALPRANAAGAA